jgi:predicted amidohydrolase/GT2 family glycosyltransferase
MRGSNKFRVASIANEFKSRHPVNCIDMNVAKAIASIKSLKASDPDLLCLAEGFLYAGMGVQRAQRVALDRDSWLSRCFSEQAKSCGAYLAVPMLERAENGNVYNTVVLFGRNGSRVGTHTKRVLWPSDAAMAEFEYGVTAGTGGGPFQTDGGRIGIQTCLEIHFQAGWLELKRSGAKLILFPSEQAAGALLGYRAWDARSYVLSAVSKRGVSQLRDPVGNLAASWLPEATDRVVTLSLDYELTHLDYNETKLRSLARRLRGRVMFNPFKPERLCLVTSLVPDISVKTLLKESGILTLDEYLARIEDRVRNFHPAPEAREARVNWPAAGTRPIRNISVIVPTTPGSTSLRNCLEALMRQNVRLPYNILVVVNGPASDSFECPVADITVIREPRVGPAIARNRGVRETTADCIAFIDDDCIASPHWLAAAVDALQETGSKAIIAGAISRSGARVNAISLFDSVSYLQQENYVIYSGACVTANVCMHRKTFFDVGTFDETFREAACEDWEWSIRARRRSIPIVFARSAVVDHPCMKSFQELKRKAQRLARGEVRLNEIVCSRAKPRGLLAQMARQLKRFVEGKQIELKDKPVLCALSLLVAFWMWKAVDEPKTH